MADHPTPKEAEVKQMLRMLFGNDLTVTPVETTLATDADSTNPAAVFVSDDDTPVTACVCDINFAAFAGAALTKIPKGGAEDAAESGELTENMLGNLNEVMNICSRLFMKSDSPHLRLENLYTSVKDVPESSRAMLDAITKQFNVQVTIPGYGNGHLSFLAT